jgi:hypothetical protein
VIFTDLRVRAMYAVALVLGGMLGVVAVKSARRQQRLVAQNTALAALVSPASTEPTPGPPARPAAAPH